MKNGSIWKDIDKNDIQAHGGCIVNFNGTYYWYGENKGLPNREGKTSVDVIGISCYSSKDLLKWKYEGLVLESDKENEQSYLHFSKVVERPKVIYNEKNNNYVMIFHLDNADYTLASLGFAVCDIPNGKFKFINAIKPHGLDSRDMTVFVDDNKKAYVFFSSYMNWTMVIATLDENYTNFTNERKEILINQQREAPAIFKNKGRYYMFSSGCTGWHPNACLYAETDEIFGKWTLMDNPCVGKDYRKTFYGQSSYVFEVNGKFYLMLDHWLPNNLQKSAYSILPITFDKNDTLTVKWNKSWKGIK